MCKCVKLRFWPMCVRVKYGMQFSIGKESGRERRSKRKGYILLVLSNGEFDFWIVIKVKERDET